MAVLRRIRQVSRIVTGAFDSAGGPLGLRSGRDRHGGGPGVFLLLGIVCAIFLLPASVPSTVTAQSDATSDDLTEMSLEELMSLEVEVTSVSKRAQKLSEAATAVYVLTGDDIRRSGATTIADALRAVPGLQVASISRNEWAVTSRGFNGDFANKLLVLMDGRSVYSPLYSGVYWDVQDVLLEDIDRIEVIRGPGATLWGANAVNGVINIITKRSRDTQGTYFETGGGSREQGFGSFRHGGKAGEQAFFRVYGKYFNRDHSVDFLGHEVSDSQDMFRAGLRLDWDLSQNDALTLHGDIYDGTVAVPYTSPVLAPPYLETSEEEGFVQGGNALARWTHFLSESSETDLQLCFDRTLRDHSFFRVERNTFDVDFNHHFTPLARLDVIWGLGYRTTSDFVGAQYSPSLDPEHRTDNLYSTFVQGEIAVIEDMLRLTLGSKFEHNDYTGFEFQPNARVLWLPHQQHTLWAAVSRAVRTPSRVEHDGTMEIVVLPPNDPKYPSPVPVLVVFSGDRDFESEVLVAYEVGYRVQPGGGLSLDAATFVNVYDQLQSGDLGEPEMKAFPTSHVLMPVTLGNHLGGETYGAELVARWRPRGNLCLTGQYTYLQLDLRQLGSTVDNANDLVNSDSPTHQISLGTAVDFANGLELDLTTRYVDRLSTMDVDSYLTLDARAGWTPYPGFHVSLVGQDLLEATHSEYKSSFDNGAGLVERRFYGKVAWRF